MRDVAIIDGVRTPVGTMGGALRDVPAKELGRIVVTELLKKTNLDPALVEEVIVGQGGQTSDAPNTARVIALLAGLPMINFLAEMTSIGTLVAFLVVSIGVIVLRRASDIVQLRARSQTGKMVPLGSIAGCIWIIQDLRAVTIYVFLGWAAVALAWYFAYGIRHSKLGQAKS